MYGYNFHLPPRVESEEEKALASLPIDYPVPSGIEHMLFYLQRNHNRNTIFYQLNLHPSGLINESEPILIRWIRYEEDGAIKPLNIMQDRLIYGYRSKKINATTYQIRMVAKPEHTFYLVQNRCGEYVITTEVHGEMSIVQNIYAYAHYHGAFPSIKHIEIYGCKLDGSIPVYKKVQY